MLLPTLREIKHRHPNVHLTFSVDRYSTDNDIYWNLVKNVPFIDSIICATKVVESNYDLYYDLSSVCIPYERKELPSRERIDIFANYLGFQKLSNPLPFYKVEPEEQAWARALIRRHRPKRSSPIVFLHTASNDSKRSWHVDSQREFLQQLYQQYPDVLVVVSDFNSVFGEKEWAAIPASSIVNIGRAGIREAAALINESDVFVGPDSALMHLAGALKKESVVLFGAIPPGARLSYYPTHHAIAASNLKCLGCWYEPCPYDTKCMKEIDVSEVVSAVGRLIHSVRIPFVFESVLNPCDGYGSSAEQMALALSDNIDGLRYASCNTTHDWEQFAHSKTKALVTRKGSGNIYLGYYAPLGLGSSLYPLASKADSRYIYTTFESTRVPLSWVEHVNEFDKLFVSCNTIALAFKDTGVSIPIVVVPLGVDPLLWPYKKREQSNRPLRLLLFANVEWAFSRKNYAMAFNAFKEAFGDRKDVELWLKVTHGDVPKYVLEASNVKIISGRFLQQQLVELLHSVDCLLFPSKGEGFGLPPREAMSTGIPVIAAGFAGLEPIMNASYNYSIDYDLVDAIYDPPYDKLLIEDNYGSSDFGQWASPSQESLVDVLVSIADNKNELIDRGLSCANWVRENETYADAADKLLAAMNYK